MTDSPALSGPIASRSIGGGYTEEEWVVAGVADAFDPDGVRIDVAVPYCTRFLVRRPTDPTQASGTVFLDPLHMIGEMPASWDAADWMIAQRHVWVGVSVHNSSFGAQYGFRGGIDAVKASDPDRYTDLHLATFDRPPRLRTHPGPSGVDSFALEWSMAMAHPQGNPILVAVANLLRDDVAFEELGVARVYGCGVSQTGNLWRRFVDTGWHDRGRRSDGSPPFEAYVVVVAPAPVHHPVDAILVNILSEAEVVGTIIQHRAEAPPDTDVPAVRGIELPGAPHSIGHAEVEQGGHDHCHTVEPHLAFFTAALANLDSWVREGVPMPRVAPIVRDPRAVDGILRDEHGNAVGGLRLPWIAVPRAQYLPRCSCGPTLGETRVFAASELDRLYASDADHEALWVQAVDRLVADRQVLAEDRDLLLDHRRSWPIRAARE